MPYKRHLGFLHRDDPNILELKDSVVTVVEKSHMA